MKRAVAAAMVLAGSLFGQSQSASLNGSITDSSGAAVPRAAVRLVNSDTGDTYQASSNESGNYDFPLLKPGRYNLTAELTGFKQVRENGIVLETGAPSRVDLKLEVGAITDKVTVEAAAPLVQSETAAVGSVVQNKTIIDMPLIDRRGAQLAKLNGYTVQNTTGSSPQFSMGGGRGNNANWRIDGGNNNNILLGTSGVGFDPPIDSLQEFNVSISDYSAELGRTGGGVILMTTKSGTNDFHGSAYEYFRNTALNTRSFFASKVPIRITTYLAGASVGQSVRTGRSSSSSMKASGSRHRRLRFSTSPRRRKRAGIFRRTVSQCATRPRPPARRSRAILFRSASRTPSGPRSRPSIRRRTSRGDPRAIVTSSGRRPIPLQTTITWRAWTIRSGTATTCTGDT